MTYNKLVTFVRLVIISKIISADMMWSVNLPGELKAMKKMKSSLLWLNSLIQRPGSMYVCEREIKRKGGRYK